MINYMKNFDFVRVLEKENQILLFNESNMNSVIIHEEIYKMICNMSSLDDFDNIVEEYSEDDQEFFAELRKVFVRNNIFEELKAGVFNRINYIITDYCNLFCKHCCYSALYLEGEKENIIDKELEILDKIISMKPEVISITGGEPLSINNFEQVLKRLNNSGIPHKNLQTNGTLISEDNINKLVECFNSFDISLDGSTPEETELLRGKGTYEKVLKAIELLKKNHVNNISVSYAMNTEDMDKRIRFEQLCKTLGVKPIVRQLSSVGRAEKNKLVCKDQKYEFFYDMYGEYCNCPAGKSEITVNNKGEVFPCINFLDSKFKVGTIFDDNLLNKIGWSDKNLWYREFSKYLPFGRDECKECEVNVLCWHCPLQVKRFMEVHDIQDLSTICESKKKAIWERIWNGK